ncbi:MAG: hypothetical protein PHU47_01630 [Candidatus ainarchaeum sp.]|nr:hypothetical protein [Candidatus ainarchaeum sp.]
MKGFGIIILFIFILLTGCVYSFEYNDVREITINDSFFDLNIFIDFGYYKISDSNNQVIDQYNLFENIDLNQIVFNIDSIDHREKEYNLVIDENIDLREKDFYFDLNNLTITGSLKKVFDLNLEITNFYKKEDLLFIISDTNLFVYRYEDKEYRSIFRIDTNQTIYNLEYLFYLDKNYLFLANGSNGVGIYEIDFNSSEIALNLGRAVFSFDGFDYDTSYIYFLESAHSGSYLFSFVTNLIQLRYVLYDLNGLINNNNYIENGFILGGAFFPQTIWHNQDLNRLIIPLKNSTNTGKIDFIDEPSGLAIFSSGQFLGIYKDLDSLSNKAFSLNTDKLNVYNKDSIGGPTSPIKTLDLNYSARSFTINKDQNRFFVLFDNNIQIFDYNYEDNNFLLFKTISEINTDLNKIVYNNNSLIITEDQNFTKISLDHNYSLSFFIPFPKINDLSITPQNINYSLYNSFLGDLNFSFIIEDYNILKNDSNFLPLSFDLNLTNENKSISILNDQNIDNNICTNVDLTTKSCNVVFNIKTINNIHNLTNGQYQLKLITNNIYSTPLNFDLTHSTGGSGGSSGSGSAPSTSQPKTDFSPNKYTEILDLLKLNYFQQKQLFERYLLNFPNLNFDLNFSDINFSKNYDLLLDNYNNLPKLKIIDINYSQKDPFFNNEDYSFVSFNNKKITQLLVISDTNKEYLFVEIDNNNDQLILDHFPYFVIAKTSFPITRFDNNFIYIESNLNYLVNISYKDQVSFNTIKIEKISRNKEILEKEIIYKEENEKTNNNKLIYIGASIFLLFFLAFRFRGRLFY